jgi:hypothetical protein
MRTPISRHALTSGHADPVGTHVHLYTREDDAFAREVLDIGERTYFLHAWCRTVVPVHVRVTTAPRDEPFK